MATDATLRLAAAIDRMCAQAAIDGPIDGMANGQASSPDGGAIGEPANLGPEGREGDGRWAGDSRGSDPAPGCVGALPIGAVPPLRCPNENALLWLAAAGLSAGAKASSADQEFPLPPIVKVVRADDRQAESAMAAPEGKQRAGNSEQPPAWWLERRAEVLRETVEASGRGDAGQVLMDAPARANPGPVASALGVQAATTDGLVHAGVGLANSTACLPEATRHDSAAVQRRFAVWRIRPAAARASVSAPDYLGEERRSSTPRGFDGVDRRASRWVAPHNL